MRVFWIFAGIVAAASAVCSTPIGAAQAAAVAGTPATAEEATRLVREVVYNELHDHDTHGFWRRSV
jgi:hypothetical protein